MDFFDFHHHKPFANGIYNLNIGEDTPGFPFSAGIHPKDVGDKFEDKFNNVKESSLLHNCFAIGECGLDAIITTEQKTQEDAFLRHLQWANEIRKPVIIHCVRRFNEVIKLSTQAKVPLIIHGFNKNESIAIELLRKGFYLSFGKAVLYSVSLQHILKEAPINKIFLETDTADIHIAELYLKTSEIRNISTENLQAQILENLQKITKL